MTNKKRIYLHIGMHKTGSSAIQHALKKHERFLRKRGYFPIWMLNDLREIHNLFANENLVRDLTDQEVDKAREKFKNLFARTREENIIISSEAFERQGPKIGQLLRGLYSEITIIGYFSRQDTFCESVYQQLTKAKRIDQTFDEFLKKSELSTEQLDGVSPLVRLGARLDWESILDAYRNSFPGAVIKPAIFELVLQKEDIFRHLCHQIGIDHLPPSICAEYKNPGLPKPALEILRRCQKELSNKEYALLRKKITDWATANVPKGTSRYSNFSKQNRLRFIESFHEKNLEFFQKYGLGSGEDVALWESIDDTDDFSSEDSLVILAKCFTAKSDPKRRLERVYAELIRIEKRILCRLGV